MRKKSIRKLTPRARMLAHLHRELVSVSRRLKNVIGLVQELELGLIRPGRDWTDEPVEAFLEVERDRASLEKAVKL